MGKKKDKGELPIDPLGKLNHGFLAGNYRKAGPGIIDVCRWCLRPTPHSDQVAACPTCDMIEV